MQARSTWCAHPIRTVILSFLAWKTLLIIIATASPGPGYDTSASLVDSYRGLPEKSVGELPALLRYCVERLTRWDAIYFVKTATRGYLFEQEWAFGWGFSRLIALTTAAIGKIGLPHYEGLEALVAVAIAHLAHLLSALVLLPLGLAIFPRFRPEFALTAACLHIISPAGLFLSAPYAESSCALLTFSGVLLFAKSFASKDQSTVGKDYLVVLSGILFGIATTLRSNGILNGLLLLEEALTVLISLRNGLTFTRTRRLLATGLGGMSVGAGFLLPQYIAWSEYCGQTTRNITILRPWCQNTLPSIYSFVQGHYWNAGLFHYWTFSNIPLFLLATPMISLMTLSGLWALKFNSNKGVRPSKLQNRDYKVSEERESEAFPILRSLAVVQLILTVITLMTAHVQIITRISSAYPVCLWYLVALSQKGSSPLAGNFVRFMVIYAVVQAGLFASFLPPA